MSSEIVPMNMRKMRRFKSSWHVALAAQSHVLPTGDPEAAGISWKLIVKYFYGHSLPSTASEKDFCQFLAIKCAQY